ncbi:PH domain-containing protein [Halocalculus aciditolerans]|uniref:YdbS-like PH domain-containing protein n=1 Tax=Halocalculus aciditolerans TaxID=1383812 RepID=A0A830FC53_9EURY|nr:PH domain-containing protein [Halocalculus aciditolerans]GGL59855.1 hypothetical protein GCM10009039_17600 [Halocalculus aciditolerans]
MSEHDEGGTDETERTKSAPVSDAIPLGDGETVVWVGRPRWTVALPAVAVGLVLALAAGVVAWRTGFWPLYAVVPFGLALAGWREVARRGVQYAVTDRAVYVKRGVLGRRVTQVTLDTVQNSSSRQSVSGSLFGYGTVHVAVAGGADLAFDRVDDPSGVRRLLDDQLQQTSGELPGSLDDWRAVRGEVRALRRALANDDGQR